TETKVACVAYCRERGVPYLGICLGFQMAVVEFARHVCGLSDAASTEFNPKSAAVVIDILPEQKKIEGLGGTMRLGGQDVLIKPDTLAAFLFRDQKAEGRTSRAGGRDAATQPFMIRQRFRHR